MRQEFLAVRTPQANQVRDLLTEFGLVIPVGIRSIKRKLLASVGDAKLFHNVMQPIIDYYAK